MKVCCVVIVSSFLPLIAIESCNGFTPLLPRASFGRITTGGSTRRFMSEPTDEELDSMTMEEEIETMVQMEKAKYKRASNLRNENGVEFAPWMNISPEDEQKIRSLVKEKAAARRLRQEQERTVSGNLYRDSQGQELSGTGLKSKVFDVNEVELEWATKDEKDTKGFLVKRRATKTTEFEVLASYEEWGPLQSKGPEGGIYRFLDTTASPGAWVYRITECDAMGSENDICQCLVEIQTQEEQRSAVIAAVGIVVFGIVAVAAGILLDPVGGY